MSNNPQRAAKPTKEIFDPFNSSATGHQRAENRLSGSTAWRDSRHYKLGEQLKSGAGGGKRVSDTVVVGSLPSKKHTQNGSSIVGWSTPNGQPAVHDAMTTTKEVERPSKRMKLGEGNSALHRASDAATPASKSENRNTVMTAATFESSPSFFLSPIDPNASISNSPLHNTQEAKNNESAEKPRPQVFANLNFYINGSTAPAVSDHRLKHILAEHGARISVALGRRTVTHVIVGRPNSSGGSGGGLSASKIQKEIASKRGESVKYVTADWVLESVKAGERLPESRFEALRLAPKGMGSLATLFAVRPKATADSPVKDKG